MDERDVEPIGSRPRPVSRGSQFVDYFFWLLYSLLAIRLLLVLMDARARTGFVQFIATITSPFYAPFEGIVASPEVGETGMVLAVPILVALVVYALLHLAIHKLLQVLAYRQTVV
jgi:uncharacterized protein YggT (Ycf19 family)